MTTWHMYSVVNSSSDELIPAYVCVFLLCRPLEHAAITPCLMPVWAQTSAKLIFAKQACILYVAEQWGCSASAGTSDRLMTPSFG